MNSKMSFEGDNVWGGEFGDQKKKEKASKSNLHLSLF